MDSISAYLTERSFFPSAVAIASAQIVFSRARRPRKVEGEAESARVAFAESPLCEDELVASHQAQCFVQRGARARRENYIGESSGGDDRLDRRPAARDSAGDKIPNW